MFKKMKENKKKGFTLVELIVVLVILAILAALLIPALTGYINKAKNKSIVAETRQVVMAAQTLVDEAYAKNQGSNLSFGASSSTSNDAVVVGYDDVKELAEVEETPSAGEIKDGKVTTIKYVHAGKTCIYYADTTSEAYTTAAAAKGATAEGNYIVTK